MKCECKAPWPKAKEYDCVMRTGSTETFKQKYVEHQELCPVVNPLVAANRMAREQLKILLRDRKK